MALIGLMSHNFWLLFIGLALYSMVNAAGMPIGDSLASTWQQQIHLDYGKARLIGSFAFVVRCDGIPDISLGSWVSNILLG